VAATFLIPPLDFDQLNHTGLSINHHGSIDDVWLGHADANGGGMSRRAAAASMDEAMARSQIDQVRQESRSDTNFVCVFSTWESKRFLYWAT
jgi:hypothetical protein